MVVTRTVPSGAATSVCRPFSSDDGVVRRGRRPGVGERPGLDVGPLGVGHRGELARMRREHGRHAERSGHVGERVGIHDNRYAVGDRRLEGVAGPVATSGTHRPGLDAAVPHDVGADLPDPVGDLVVADVADHAAQPGGRAGHAEQTGAGVPR